MSARIEIAVIGAGVVGMTTALRLAAEGHEVAIIDPETPGSGASYGNAGTIAEYAVTPLGSPDLLRNLPSLLFDRDSPFSLRYGALPGLAPWFARFLRECTPGRARMNALALAELLRDAGPLWIETAAAAGAADLIRRDGVLYLYERAEAFANAGTDREFRRSLGVEIEVLDAAGVAKVEPELRPIEGGAHFFPGIVHLTDPGAMMARLAAAMDVAGVTLVPQKVQWLERTGDGVQLNLDKGKIVARRVVIAAGAYSRPLAAMAGDRVPLDTERGYHIEYDMENMPLQHVVASGMRGFYAIPMAGRMRFSGMVEMANLRLPPDPKRWDLLERHAATFLPGLGAPSRKWMGFRPSVPSTVPVIRASKGGDDVVLAFGHGHLGLTMAPRTAQIVAELIGR
ncbi:MULTISPECIES: NAD(P)/FAD-dependent oxidoreductase [unclassified Marinovum]